MADKLRNLEELPEFFTYPEKLFRSKTEVPIYEIARLTYRKNNHVDQPYRLQEVVHVVGRSVNQGYVRGPKEYTIFCAQQAMTRLDSTKIAVNSTGKGVRTVELDYYEILRSNEKLFPLKNKRELRTPE
jgi:hypothetical protein